MTDKQIEAALAVCEKRTGGYWREGTGNVWLNEHVMAETRRHMGNAAYIAATTDPDTGYEAALRDLREARAECDRRAVRIDDWLHSYNRASREADQLRAQLREAALVIHNICRHKPSGLYFADQYLVAYRSVLTEARDWLAAHADLLTEEKS